MTTLARLLGLNAGDSPFPWQERLLAEHFMKGEIPDALDIPTGLGKTSVIAIWTAARAAGAKVPLRLIYVVDRRAVVDQATTEAERIRSVIEGDAELAKGLGLTAPLPISTLRGQYVDNQAWLEDPSVPAIVIGTVDMIGSRFLFQGYRCSKKMRPYHAALLGADALVVLDEAHLVPAFEALLRSAATDPKLKGSPMNEHCRAVPNSQIMSLSATGRGANNTFILHESDYAHPTVRRRLDAKKNVRLAEPIDADALADTLARKAWELTNNGTQASRVIVFVDSRKAAQAVHGAIEGLAKGSSPKIPIETELFVGGRRVAEREAAAKRLGELGVIAGSKMVHQTPVFVIATSAGEVGVDLDADHAVLDLVEWERMVQRLGRVNRRGDGDATVWVVPTTIDEKTKEALTKDAKLRAQRGPEEDSPAAPEEDTEDQAASDKPPKRLKEDERMRVEQWRRREATERAIRELPVLDRAHDASPRALTDLKKHHAALIEEGSTPAPLHPELTRAVLESWSMTSLDDHTGRPDVRPWLRGWVEEEPQTTVVWRSWLPRQKDAAAFFEAAPVETTEILERESKDVLDWLGKRAGQMVQASEAARDVSEDDDTQARLPRVSPADVVMYVLEEPPSAWTLTQLDGGDTSDRDRLFRSIAGQTIVVDVRLGGLDDHGLLDPKASAAIDVSENLRLPFRVREVEDLIAIKASADWRVEGTFASRTNDDGEAIAWLVVETDTTVQATTADGRSTGREQRLDEHQAFAERHARSIGVRLGLRPQHVNLLALAAVLHDEGKKAERWQRAFRAPKEKRPLGKTTSRPLQSILAHYRHELGSLPYAERDPRVVALSAEDRDLVLHMIAAHHGFARPILRTDGCDDAPPSALVERARTVALRFARLEKSWGPWGLAWWETLLRAADQGASRENDLRGSDGG